MNIGASIGNILKAAFVVGSIYAFMNWDFDVSQDDGVRDFAEKACIDEINIRFDTSMVRVYAINANSNGYIVRATVTLVKGSTAKVYCLTNTHGGVKVIAIQDR